MVESDWWVNVGGYKGPATIAGHYAEVDLIATRSRQRDDHGGVVLGNLRWRGLAIFVVPPSDLFELQRSGSITIKVAGRVGAASIVHANTVGDLLDLAGQGDPPFDTVETADIEADR